MRHIFILLALMFFSAVTAQEQLGGFIYVEQIDPITDADDSFIYTVEESNPSREAKFFWGCKGDDLMVLLSANEYLTGEENAQVVPRFDSNPALSNQTWETTPDGTGLMSPEYFVESITAQALESTKVALQTSDYQGARLVYVFDVTGFAEAFDRLACSESF